MVQFFGFAIFGRKGIVDKKSQLPVLNVDEGRSTLQILQVDVLEDPSVDDHVILHLDTEEVLDRVKICTANEGPVRNKYKCLVSMYVFPEMNLLFPKQK